jgi:hypothetical protein
MQSQLVSALLALHNFIHVYDPADIPDEELANDLEEEPSQEESNLRKWALNNEAQ